MLDLNKIERVMVFGAHGDDEIIGCGGTLAYLSELEKEICVITFTYREMSYLKVSEKSIAMKSADQEMQDADEILGIGKRVVFGLPCRGVVNDKENFERCMKLIRNFRPHVIFTHSPTDFHRDHRAVSLMTDEAREKAWENLQSDWGDPWHTPLVFYYEIFNLISHPSLIVTFTKECLNKKLKAMESQVSQISVLRGIKQQILGRAMERGAFAGGEGVYGEAFKLSDYFPMFLRQGE